MGTLNATLSQRSMLQRSVASSSPFVPMQDGDADIEPSLGPSRRLASTLEALLRTP